MFIQTVSSFSLMILKYSHSYFLASVFVKAVETTRARCKAIYVKNQQTQTVTAFLQGSRGKSEGTVFQEGTYS